MEAHPGVAKTLVFAVFLSLAAAGAAAAQLPEPYVTLIPDQISAGSSFAIVADPGEVTGSG